MIACCQEIDISFSGTDEYLMQNLGMYLEGTWSVGGISNGADYYTFQDYLAIWYYQTTTIPHWILGPLEGLGGAEQYYMRADGLNKNFFGKCPNKHGQITWSWRYISAEGTLVPTNDILIKCASEDDLCTLLCH